MPVHTAMTTPSGSIFLKGRRVCGALNRAIYFGSRHNEYLGFDLLVSLASKLLVSQELGVDLDGKR